MIPSVRAEEWKRRGEKRRETKRKYSRHNAFIDLHENAPITCVLFSYFMYFKTLILIVKLFLFLLQLVASFIEFDFYFVSVCVLFPFCYETFADSNSINTMSPENEDNINSMSSAYTGKYHTLLPLLI